jgi:hypothetical protein
LCLFLNYQIRKVSLSLCIVVAVASPSIVNINSISVILSLKLFLLFNPLIFLYCTVVTPKVAFTISSVNIAYFISNKLFELVVDFILTLNIEGYLIENKPEAVAQLHHNKDLTGNTISLYNFSEYEDLLDDFQTPNVKFNVIFCLVVSLNNLASSILNSAPVEDVKDANVVAAVFGSVNFADVFCKLPVALLIFSNVCGALINP